ncbi:MAG: protein phosphatase 2C domain-containing protein [gamma proteobacterium symbiont of Lucinoma myriamae]|nr:protein phosphatase 2C domain-containing protein [gamma proteobacterium symbiont of Lucinoma myriamae]MCU7818211.1 protein phosphatase 2C domain-containing protein [gamma proteobacterium symbiont of Lucinoma myriamae]MCU7832315.1 protein phosphatase 2C domain-containing protein [gamma proteobacterium symbiont of Lucinoma myriamae]
MENQDINSGCETIHQQCAGDSSQGRMRAKNEDCFAVLPEQGIFFVADGMGGLPAGETASMLVLNVLPTLLTQRIVEPETLSQKTLITILKQAIIDLSNRILKEGRKRPEYVGMGSTLVLLFLTKKDMFIAHLGDSRAYVLKGNMLQQVTSDHTLAHHLLMCHEITEDEALHHPGKEQLLQYVGMTRSPHPDVICLPRVAGERVLLCSDGLTNMLSDQEITRFLLQNSPPDKTCKALIKAANLSGGKDNITVVLAG